MSGRPEPSKRETARDQSVRSLAPPSGALRGLAERLGCELYDGRRAAAEAGLALPLPQERSSVARRLPFL